MKKNGDHRTYDLGGEITFCRGARAVPSAARPGLLSWVRRARRAMPGRRRRGRPARAFWLLDPASGEWRRL